MENNFQASDADGDLIKYMILPITDYSPNFDIANENDLSTLYYKGEGIVDGVSVNLLIQVKLKLILVIVSIKREIHYVGF